jgi:hypothetical protein
LRDLRRGRRLNAVTEEHLGELGEFRLGEAGVAVPFDGGPGGDELVLVRTEMYSPVAIDAAPATSPARISAVRPGPLPPTPAIRGPFVTRPSSAPNTTGRSLPPETPRCWWIHPASV